MREDTLLQAKSAPCLLTPTQGTPGSRHASSGALIWSTSRGRQAHTSQMSTGANPTGGCSQDYIHKAHQSYPSPRPLHTRAGCRLTRPCQLAVCMKVGVWTHHSGAFLILETGRNGGGKPSPQGHTNIVRMCTHCPGNILHGVRPQPAPFQSKGRG